MHASSYTLSSQTKGCGEHVGKHADDANIQVDLAQNHDEH